MAKPILIIKFPEPSKIEDEDKKRILEMIDSKLKKEYHVLGLWSPDIETISFQCVNDCKGLPDVDIEKMINELLEKYK